MHARKIVFATDFSPCSGAALVHAASLARDRDATLLIVHVREPAERLLETGDHNYPIDMEEADLVHQLSVVQPPFLNVECCRKLIKGDPATEIVRLAAREKADAIVMGTHGRRGLTRLLMGSVAEEVLRHAPCPVLTVKQPSSSNGSA